ncbi:MAG: copper homeostasis protein CutC [Flavobacteriaceae bacterium]|nr:copper homeostasis protein CutC [Flavobacteriaceae bacterium]
MLLEICAANIQSAINAEKAGAHRIELCSELAVGGITPSFGTLKTVLETVSLPVFVLIRPRSGNFIYTEDEFEVMKADIRQSKSMGCAGIVSGVLNADNSIDFERTKELVEVSTPLPFTFHRAFDCVNDPMEGIDQLAEIGVNRILTSGQQATAEDGLRLLVQLKEKANKRLIVLPGGGINAENAKLFKQNGFLEIHASASALISKTEKPKIAMNSATFFEEGKQFESNSEIIQSILKSIQDEV